MGGKYQIGDSKALIYMRILRNHVMVRVGGGWDTLENYLNKHDPCRCNRHRAERHLKSNLTVERKKSGHVITNRLSVSPNVRPASSTGSSTDVMSKTLPSSFTHRRSRPLKDDSNSTSTPKRSQTPSRYSQRPSSAASNHSMSSSFSHTPTQSRYQSSTPKTRTSTRSTPKSDGPSTRTRRLTSNESTSKYTQSRESSVERVLEDKRTRSRSYEPKSSQIQLKIQRDQIDDGELTLDDLETKFSIDDIDVNPIVNPSEVNNLSLSLNSKRIPRKTTAKPRQELRPGSSRSRIPVPVPSRSTTNRAQSPDFNPNYSPERADSGIDIYTEFETSPTNSIRRNGQNVRHNQRPPDIPEQS